MIPKRGEVWLADLGFKGKTRPVLIVSRDDSDAPRVLTTFVNITSNHLGSRYEVPIPHVGFLNDGSTINTQGFGTQETKSVGVFLKRLGVLDNVVMAQVESALRYTLGMED